jgi:exosome complex component RRP46
VLHPLVPTFGELILCAGPRERHLELLVHSTLRSVILVRAIPRTLVQITLQVRSLPEEDATCGIDSVCPARPRVRSRCAN